MSALRLETPDGRTEFEPGQDLEVTAGWDLETPPEAVEVRLVWYTRGKGNTDISVVASERLENVDAIGTRTLRFRLPPAPYSFSGKIVSLVWAVELVVFPGDESHRLDITVAPQGKEIVIAPSLQRIYQVMKSLGESSNADDETNTETPGGNDE